MSLDYNGYLIAKGKAENLRFKMNLDTFSHFIALRKGKNKSPYRYDIYHNESNNPKYIGRVKVNQNLTISKSSNEIISNAELNEFDKQNLESFLGVLNVNNSEYMRFVWLRYNQEGQQFFYIDHRE